MTRSRQTADWGSRAGLAKVIPSSVAVGSGTGSADTTGKVTFSGASSVSLNTSFTTTYQNYRILINMDSVSASGDILVRLRNSGSDNSSSVYGNAVFYMDSGGSYGGGVIGATSTNWTIAYIASTMTASTYALEVYAPQISKQTGMSSWQVRHSSTTTGACEYRGGTHVHGTTASYDSITIYPASGTMTGNLTVYGYN